MEQGMEDISGVWSVMNLYSEISSFFMFFF